MRTSHPLAPVRYELPLGRGVSSRLLQGYSGPYGHQDKLQYAYDFQVSIGTPIVAAREGRVVQVEDSFEDNTKSPGKENYIFVAHDDGTFSRYYHLTKKGVLVRQGEKIQRGQLIAKSGNSGASAGPHLHFDVTRECPEWGCQTIPITFTGVEENPLAAGKTYSNAAK